MIVQVFTLHGLAGIIIIEIFEVKIVYKIYPYGICNQAKQKTPFQNLYFNRFLIKSLDMPSKYLIKKRFPRLLTQLPKVVLSKKE